MGPFEKITFLPPDPLNKDATLPFATPIKLLVYWFTATSGESKRMLIFL